MAHLEFFSEARIELNKEVRHHPELQQLLATLGSDDFEDRLACVAAYCSVIVDGFYTPSELDRLCDILIQKLRDKRIVIVNTSKH